MTKAHDSLEAVVRDAIWYLDDAGMSGDAEALRNRLGALRWICPKCTRQNQATSLRCPECNALTVGDSRA